MFPFLYTLYDSCCFFLNWWVVQFMHFKFPWHKCNWSCHLDSVWQRLLLLMHHTWLQMAYLHQYSEAGFPTGVANMGGGGGGSSKLDGGRLKSKHGESTGELKMLSKNTCEGVHLIVKLPAKSLQVSKFTKNELLHTYFWSILARFEVIIYCAFSRNHFMEHGKVFHVSMGRGVCFSDGGLHF